jgi:uncharacterized protein (UPF0332 family)
MDSTTDVYLERADTELLLAEAILILSKEDEKKKVFGIPARKTFYSAVISHSYYAIFYSAYGLLVTKNIRPTMPDVHKKTFEAFKEEFVDSGILDVKLLEIYKKMVIRADALLMIFKDEKWKRGHFTYQTIAQANQEPAEDSLKNAHLFHSNIIKITRKL